MDEDNKEFVLDMASDELDRRYEEWMGILQKPTRNYEDLVNAYGFGMKLLGTLDLSDRVVELDPQIVQKRDQVEGTVEALRLQLIRVPGVEAIKW